jgi:hypothetical protein
MYLQIDVQTTRLFISRVCGEPDTTYDSWDNKTSGSHLTEMVLENTTILRLRIVSVGL